MDAERRRLSLSLKRVDESEAGQPRPEGAPPLALSEEVFTEESLCAHRGEAGESEEPAAEAVQPSCEAKSPRSRPSRRSDDRRRRRRRGRSRRRSRARRRGESRLTNPSPDEDARRVKLALTGGIGAGKSEALEAFRRHGAAVLSSDHVVHGSTPRMPMFALRSSSALALLDRARIGELVFSDLRSSRGSRGCSIHACDRYAAWLEGVDAHVAVVEIPLLYETGADACSMPSSSSPRRQAFAARGGVARSTNGRRDSRRRGEDPPRGLPTSTTARSPSSTPLYKPFWGDFRKMLDKCQSDVIMTSTCSCRTTSKRSSSDLATAGSLGDEPSRRPPNGSARR